MPSLQHHQVELRTGVSLHYVEQGPIKGPVVLLCHGWPEFWYCWHKQIPAIASEGFRVVVPDLRGFGQTKIPHGPNGREQYTMKVVSEDMIALMDHLNVPKFVIIGHDWGGAFVWNMARRYPERVIAVGSVCTPYMPRSQTFIPLKDVIKKYPSFEYQLFFAEQRETAAKLMESDIPRFLRALFSKTPPEKQRKPGGLLALITSGEPPAPPVLSPEEFNFYVETYKKTGFANCLHWYGTGELNYKQEIEDKVPLQVSQPALMVTCGQDRVLLPSLSENMGKVVSKLSRGHIEDAGHWVQAEKPEELNKILISWLQSLSLTKLASKL